VGALTWPVTLSALVKVTACDITDSKCNIQFIIDAAGAEKGGRPNVRRSVLSGLLWLTVRRFSNRSYLPLTVDRLQVMGYLA
jgi:hypothetical protein